jgi:hypothetical protein
MSIHNKPFAAPALQARLQGKNLLRRGKSIDLDPRKCFHWPPEINGHWRGNIRASDNDQIDLRVWNPASLNHIFDGCLFRQVPKNVRSRSPSPRHEERRKVTVEFDLQTEVHPQGCYPQKRRVGLGKINFSEFPAIPTVRRSGSFSESALAALDNCVVEPHRRATVERVAVPRLRFATRESGEGLGPEGSGDVRGTQPKRHGKIHHQEKCHLVRPPGLSPDGAIIPRLFSRSGKDGTLAGRALFTQISGPLK